MNSNTLLSGVSARLLLGTVKPNGRTVMGNRAFMRAWAARRAATALRVSAVPLVHSPPSVPVRSR